MSFLGQFLCYFNMNMLKKGILLAIIRGECQRNAFLCYNLRGIRPDFFIFVLNLEKRSRNHEKD